MFPWPSTLLLPPCLTTALASLREGDVVTTVRANFQLWQQATIKITRRAYFIDACSRRIHIGAILSAHPDRADRPASTEPWRTFSSGYCLKMK